MARRVRRGPRAHWVLLCLFVSVLLAELCLNGYVSHVGAEGGGPSAAPSTGSAAPSAVTGGAPVQRIGADGSVTSRGMPAKTIALTFDDGPDPRFTPQALAGLARYPRH